MTWLWTIIGVFAFYLFCANSWSAAQVRRNWMKASGRDDLVLRVTSWPYRVLFERHRQTL